MTDARTRIRKALPADFPAVRRLLLTLAEGFRIPSTEEDGRLVFLAHLEDPTAEVIVLEEMGARNHEVVGLITVRYFSTINLGGLQAYIVELSVHPDRRRRGYGSSLLSAAIDRATARGCRLIEVKTHPRREAARGLYASAGMSETCLVLELPLTPTARMAVASDHAAATRKETL